VKLTKAAARCSLCAGIEARESNGTEESVLHYFLADLRLKWEERLKKKLPKSSIPDDCVLT
jgi:hypothetical protein